MKRSQINRIIRETKALLAENHIHLPPFGYYTPAQFRENAKEIEEIRECGLGWDVTDYGSGDFESIGLLLFTARNGRLNDPKYQKTYAEKIMVVREGQVTPMHFHRQKMEDIINREGGILVVQVYNSTPEEGLSEEDVTVRVDGLDVTVPAGGEISLRPGESISIPTGLYHAFWGAPGFGTVLVGEVSRVNDDKTDNRFYQPCGRFPEIEEDEEAEALLMNEYPQA